MHLYSFFLLSPMIHGIIAFQTRNNPCINNNGITIPSNYPFKHTQVSCMKMNERDTNENQHQNEKHLPNIQRRTMIRQLVSSSFAILPVAFTSNDAKAKTDPLFAPNPLTNPVLEQIRIWNQAEADNISYDGELAPGSPKGRETYAKLLVPILIMESELKQIDDMIHQPNGEGLKDAMKLLDDSKYTKIAFKKTFNAFADNIYYSDPDRANMYLGGGATPKNEQSIAYLLRNDILTNVEYLQAEVAYLIKLQSKVANGDNSEPIETDDMFDYSKKANEAMVKYLELVPPGELKICRTLLSETK